MGSERQSKVSINGRDANDFTQEELARAMEKINGTLSRTLGNLGPNLPNVTTNSDGVDMNLGNLIPTFETSGNGGNIRVGWNGESILDLNLSELINDALRGRN